MKYISKERLMQLEYELRSKHSIIADHNLLISREILLAECKELPQEQWQTIEEFKANPVEGWCFVCFSGRTIEMAFYFKDEKEFHDRDDSGYSFAYKNITHVMPIKTPEAPK